MEKDLGTEVAEMLMSKFMEGMSGIARMLELLVSETQSKGFSEKNQDFINKIENMQQSEKPFGAVELKMPEQDARALSEMAKDRDIDVLMMKNEENGTYIATVFKDDFRDFSKCVEDIKEQKQLDVIQKKLDHMEDKGHKPLSLHDKKTLDVIDNQLENKKHITRDNIQKLEEEVDDKRVKMMLADEKDKKPLEAEFNKAEKALKSEKEKLSNIEEKQAQIKSIKLKRPLKLRDERTPAGVHGKKEMERRKYSLSRWKKMIKKFKSKDTKDNKGFGGLKHAIASPSKAVKPIAKPTKEAIR